MKAMKLNIAKIKQEMNRLGWNKSEVARRLGITRQAVGYYFKAQPINAALKFGKLFNINPKDLIK